MIEKFYIKTSLGKIELSVDVDSFEKDTWKDFSGEEVSTFICWKVEFTDEKLLKELYNYRYFYIEKKSDNSLWLKIVLEFRSSGDPEYLLETIFAQK